MRSTDSMPGQLDAPGMLTVRYSPAGRTSNRRNGLPSSRQRVSVAASMCGVPHFSSTISPNTFDTMLLPENRRYPAAVHPALPPSSR